MTEALNLVINYGFRHLNVNCIEGEVMVGNILSEKVLSKVGFQKEGVLREWMYWDNKHWDMILYSLLRKDYGNK